MYMSRSCPCPCPCPWACPCSCMLRFYKNMYKKNIFPNPHRKLTMNLRRGDSAGFVVETFKLIYAFADFRVTIIRCFSFDNFEYSLSTRQQAMTVHCTLYKKLVCISSLIWTISKKVHWRFPANEYGDSSILQFSGSNHISKDIQIIIVLTYTQKRNFVNTVHTWHESV